MEKKIWGKLKLNSQPAKYWKNKFDKDNLKKNMWGNTAAKQKPFGGNTVVIHSVIFEKTTKLNSQPIQYEKNKIDKNQSEKKNKS